MRVDDAIWILLIVAIAVLINWLMGRGADDCQRKLQEMQERVDWLLAELQKAATRIQDLERRLVGSGLGADRRSLLVAVASDVDGWMDLAALRSLPVSIVRIKDATSQKLSRYLNRGRLHGRAVQYLHLAAHMGADGVRLDDTVVDADWLSEHLVGVQVMVLAGCQSDEVGDWLSVVPYVVTLREDIQADDAAMFARVFWSDVMSGVGLDAALQNALMRAPAGVAEYVEHHW